MSRFNTPEEVRAWATKVAAEDIQRHKEHGYDLNPFATPGARDRWQRGWDCAAPRPYEGNYDFDTMYQRGAACRLLMEVKA